MPIFMLPQTGPRPSWLPSLGVLSEPLATGERGTAQTIDWMRRLIDESLRDERIVRLAIDIVSGTPDFDDVPKATAIYNWVHRNVRFVKDPVNKEKLYRPADLLETGAGDCDDIAMLMATLLMAIGIPARFVTVSANASEPDQFSHVYVEAELPEGSGNWVPMDAARPDSSFASEPPMFYRKRAWSLTEDSYQDLSGARKKKGGVITRRTLGQDDVIPGWTDPESLHWQECVQRTGLHPTGMFQHFDENCKVVETSILDPVTQTFFDVLPYAGIGIAVILLFRK